MKLAIKVLTEWDRENVIPFFEKHYPNCNVGMRWTKIQTRLSVMFFVDDENDLCQLSKAPSDYSILQGVPKDMELPSSERTKTREQELEECLSNFLKLLPDYGDNNTEEWGSLIHQAKQLLNK